MKSPPLAPEPEPGSVTPRKEIKGKLKHKEIEKEKALRYMPRNETPQHPTDE
jgi:hypothetical protein